MCAAQQEPSFGEKLLSSELELALHEILWRKKGFLLNRTEHLPKPRYHLYAGGAGGGVAIKQILEWTIHVLFQSRLCSLEKPALGTSPSACRAQIGRAHV